MKSHQVCSIRFFLFLILIVFVAPASLHAQLETIYDSSGSLKIKSSTKILKDPKLKETTYQETTDTNLVNTQIKKEADQLINTDSININTNFAQQNTAQLAMPLDDLLYELDRLTYEYLSLKQAQSVSQGKELFQTIQETSKKVKEVASTAEPVTTFSYFSSWFKTTQQTTSIKSITNVDSTLQNSLDLSTSDKEHDLTALKEASLKNQISALINQIMAEIPSDSDLSDDTQLSPYVLALAHVFNARFLTELAPFGVDAFGNVMYDPLQYVWEGNFGFPFTWYINLELEKKPDEAKKYLERIHELIASLSHRQVILADTAFNSAGLEIVEQLWDKDKKIVAMQFFEWMVNPALQLTNVELSMFGAAAMAFLRLGWSDLGCDPSMGEPDCVYMIEHLVKNNPDSPLIGENGGLWVHDPTVGMMRKLQFSDKNGLVDFFRNGIFDAHRIDPGISCSLLEKTLGGNRCMKCDAGETNAALALEGNPTDNLSFSDSSSILGLRTGNGGLCGNSSSGNDDGAGGGGGFPGSSCYYSGGTNISTADPTSNKLLRCNLALLKGGAATIDIMSARLPKNDNIFCKIAFATDDPPDAPPSDTEGSTGEPEPDASESAARDVEELSTEARESAERYNQNPNLLRPVAQGIIGHYGEGTIREVLGYPANPESGSNAPSGTELELLLMSKLLERINSSAENPTFGDAGSASGNAHVVIGPYNTDLGGREMVTRIHNNTTDMDSALLEGAVEQFLFVADNKLASAGSTDESIGRFLIRAHNTTQLLIDNCSEFSDQCGGISACNYNQTTLMRLADTGPCQYLFADGMEGYDPKDPCSHPAMDCFITGVEPTSGGSIMVGSACVQTLNDQGIDPLCYSVSCPSNSTLAFDWVSGTTATSFQTSNCCGGTEGGSSSGGGGGPNPCIFVDGVASGDCGSMFPGLDSGSGGGSGIDASLPQGPESPIPPLPEPNL